MASIVINFFYGWYVDETINYWKWFIRLLKTIDMDVGLIGNLQNWTSPLFGDYSLIGIIVGPIMRTFRIIFGAAFYFLIAVIAAIVYLLWIILPMIALLMIFLNLSALTISP